MPDRQSGLHDLLKRDREQLIALWGKKVKGIADAASLARSELLDHIPIFVDEIIRALYPGAVPLPPTSASAEEHGEQRLRLGFNAAEVVREYGALHESILEMAAASNVTITLKEEGIVARWINVGIADAVAQYIQERDVELQRRSAEHIGFIAHELRNPLGSALLAFQRLRQTEIPEGRTAAMVERNLRRTADLIDSVLSHAWLKLGVQPKLAPIVIKDLLHEIVAESAIQAQMKSISTEIVAPDDLTIEADPRLLRSAVSNLVYNAVKFSREGGSVKVTATAADGRLAIQVLDACGGLPPGKAEELFNPLVQRAENRSGFGLGLAIAMQAAEAHNGTIRVRDLPGTGCTFTVDIPMLVASPAAI
jgi:signal transduction histidine kinase